MNRWYLCLLAIAFLSCDIPTRPGYEQATQNRGYEWYNNFLNSALPPAQYDGIFYASRDEYHFKDSIGNDISTIQYWPEIFLFNRLGNPIFSTTDSFAVDGIYAVDGINFPVANKKVSLDFPSPVLWTSTGDNYFPPFIHSIASEIPLTINAPSFSDSLSSDQDITIEYSSPGADSVTIYAFYTGPAHRKLDPNDSIVDGFSQYQRSFLNTGKAVLPSFSLDTSLYTSFTPTQLSINIAWARGDTIHVGNKIFGFVNEVDYSQNYFLK